MQEHPGLTKSERKKICRLMDCKKLSMDACMHAAQNDRLPLRVVVQVGDHLYCTIYIPALLVLEQLFLFHVYESFLTLD